MTGESIAFVLYFFTKRKISTAVSHKRISAAFILSASHNLLSDFLGSKRFINFQVLPYTTDPVLMVLMDTRTACQFGPYDQNLRIIEIVWNRDRHMEANVIPIRLV